MQRPSASLAYVWRNDGLLDARQWPSGSGGAADFTYDAAKRPTAMTKYGDAAGSFSQTYDRDGNVTSEGRSLTAVSGDAGGNTQSFTYDGANRVTAASGLADSATYAYDHDANRTGATIGGVETTYAYDRSGALISRTDDTDTTYYLYDRYGNQTTAASAVNEQSTYAYDLGDRLTAITPYGAGSTTFTFDGLGRHASQTTASVTTSYAYLGTSETVWQTADGVTTLSAAYEPSGARVAIDLDGSDAFALADLHANAAALVNAADDAYLSATRYDAWGQTVASLASQLETPWGFQSRLDISPDPDHPLYDFAARFYAPAAGVFTQLDTYAGSPGDPLSLNRYLYAEANPATLIDPTGHYVTKGPEQEDLASSDFVPGTGGGQVAPKVETIANHLLEGGESESVDGLNL